MAKWFVVTAWGGDKIKSVDIERFTDSSVWIGGRRRSRASQYEQYFPTWAEAHASLMADAEGELDVASARLQQAQGRFGRIKGMKEPTHD